MLLNKVFPLAPTMGTSKKKKKKLKQIERLDWSLVESVPFSAPVSADGFMSPHGSIFLITTPVRFWMLEFKMCASYLSYKPLPCPYAMSVPIKGVSFGMATKPEIKNAPHPDEWFALTPTEVWKCREIHRNNFVPGLQRAWLSAFLAAHDIFPAFQGVCCMVKPHKRGVRDKPRFSLATGLQRYQMDLLEALREPKNHNSHFFRRVCEKCISLIKKLSSPRVGCLYTDYKPSNFVLNFTAEKPADMDMRLIDAEPNFTFVVSEEIDSTAQHHLLQANLFFWYVNFWSLVESTVMTRARCLEFRRALRTAVEPFFATPSSQVYDDGFRRLLVNVLLDSSKYTMYSPLSILHKYFFWRLEERDLTEKVKARMRLLLAGWPSETKQDFMNLSFALRRQASFDRRKWIFRMIEEILWCSCFPVS